ncbi:hypothetical protein [Pseudonocardia kujensis]|uniref:hypothetical protein n=1 Tax=Pseudonocardia kujensis TaxID=1128675 RepID=UPI001E413C96|nr:hypothetical protein [Pseudonocardia kujensis]
MMTAAATRVAERMSMAHQFTGTQVRGTVRALDAGRRRGHRGGPRDGPSGSSFDHSLSCADELPLIAAAREQATQAKIAMLRHRGPDRAAANVAGVVCRVPCVTDSTGALPRAERARLARRPQDRIIDVASQLSEAQ